LNYVEDLSSDFTDEGFETLFGIMPGAIHHPEMANFDENLDDIQIKMASMGKSVIYFKLDLKNIKDQSFHGKLNCTCATCAVIFYCIIWLFLT
jgi:hypothetical protein